MEPPQIVSHRIDPATPSFLALPAEIRNFVYELLFERDGLTLLHNAAAFFPRRPKLEDYGEEPLGLCHCYTCRYQGISHYECDHNAWAEVMKSEKQELKALKHSSSHGLSIGFGLLECCRQIHHESRGVLYGRNTFAFSRSTLRHDFGHISKQYGARFDTEVHINNEAYSQVNYAARWIDSIGSHYHFLRKVLIDMDAMCPSSCAWTVDYDILPFLRMMWTYPEAKCQIMFGHTGRLLSRDLHRVNTVEIDSVCLNNILNTMGVLDMLSLKRVWKSIEKIAISPVPTFRRHHVKYKRSEARNFSILEKGTRLVWEPRKPVESLWGLPKSTQEKICRYTALAPEGITINLTADKAHGLDLDLIHLFETILAGYPLTVAMTSRTAVTDFEKFRGLDYLLYPDAANNGVVSRIARGEYGRTWGQNINLNFMLSQRKDFTDIQINIKGLVRFLSSKPFLKSNTWSTINITLWDKQGAQRAKVKLPIKKLRQVVFLFFTDCLRNEERHYTTPLYIPDIWINGFGEIVRCVEDPKKFRSAGATSWQFDLNVNGRYAFEAYQELRLASVARGIRRRAKKMDEDCFIERRDECIVHAWDDLRRCVEVEWGRLSGLRIGGTVARNNF